MSFKCTRKIVRIDVLPPDVEAMVQQGHINDESKNGITCNYHKFSLVIENVNKEILGVLSAYTAFAEIYIDDIWIKPDCRKQGLGRKLLQSVEERFQGKGYNNINLVTNQFQAPKFYLKCGYQQEFVRENKSNPQLSKTFFVKFFDDEK